MKGNAISDHCLAVILNDARLRMHPPDDFLRLEDNADHLHRCRKKSSTLI